jgi:hypothetical protein
MLTTCSANANLLWNILATRERPLNALLRIKNACAVYTVPDELQQSQRLLKRDQRCQTLMRQQGFFNQGSTKYVDIHFSVAFWTSTIIQCQFF